MLVTISVQKIQYDRILYRISFYLVFLNYKKHSTPPPLSHFVTFNRILSSFFYVLNMTLYPVHKYGLPVPLIIFSIFTKTFVSVFLIGLP